MWTPGLLLLLLLACIALRVQGQEEASQEIPEEVPTTMEQAVAAEQRLSDQIRLILKHYKQLDPVGLPGVDIPDPFPVPDISHASGTTKNMRVYGVSRLRVQYVKTDLAKMEVSAVIQIDDVLIEGAYSIRVVVYTSNGKFNASVENVEIEGTVKLVVGRDGKLHADDIYMDYTYSNMKVRLENPALNSLIISIISRMMPLVIDGAKFHILKIVNQNVRAGINKQVAELPHQLPNSVAPLDFMISDARRLVQFMGYDPYKLPDYNYTTGMSYIQLSHIWVMGLATFHRVGDVTVSFEKHVMKAAIQMGTLRLGGRCRWELSTLAGYVNRAGAAQFTVDYVQASVVLIQPLDTRQHPELEAFDVKLGDFEVRVDGTGTFDYVIELVANMLPNLLRYQIMNAIETKVKTSVQEALDRVDMEELIEERLQMLDRMNEE